MEAQQSEQAAKPDHLVILVHGINTRALWMSEIKPALERAGFVVAPTSYGKFGLLRFLSPFTSMRTKAINRVVADIRTARRSYQHMFGAEPKSMSVISHSFGTYMVSRILSDYPEFEWRRIIFCGSVVSEDYDFDRVLARFAHPLLNEIGTRDYWPALAESIGWGYGSVGSTGFNRPPVETRWHKGLRHSDFLTEKFCDRYWIPFLNGEKPARAGSGTDLPFGIRLLTALPLRWLAPLLTLAIVATLIWSLAGFFRLVPPWWWSAPDVGTKEQRRSQMEQFSRDPEGFDRAPFLSLTGKWKLLMNGETVRFYNTLSINKADFRYFGTVTLFPATRGNESVSAFGNGLRCYYEVTILTKMHMKWELVRTDKAVFSDPPPGAKCPPSTDFLRFE